MKHKQECIVARDADMIVQKWLSVRINNDLIKFIEIYYYTPTGYAYKKAVYRVSDLNHKGFCCGKDGGTENNNNGSTQHRGIVMRINSVYHDNFGPNIADTTDTQNKTKSLNIRCMVFDSNAHNNVSKSDFIVQNYDAEMWCEGCVSDFGISNYNFACARGNGSSDTIYPIMHLNRCRVGKKLETSGGT